MCVTCDKLKFVRSSEKVQLQPWCVFMSELRSSREYYYRVWCQHGEQNTANFKPLNHGLNSPQSADIWRSFRAGKFPGPAGSRFPRHRHSVRRTDGKSRRVFLPLLTHPCPTFCTEHSGPELFWLKNSSFNKNKKININ